MTIHNHFELRWRDGYGAVSTAHGALALAIEGLAASVPSSTEAVTYAVREVCPEGAADERPVAVGVLPQLAPVAIQGGRLVAANLIAELAGHPAEPFHYVDKGTMATVGRRNAVAQLPGRLRFSGTPGWMAWLGLHLIMLIGFRNRANVMVNWAWNYVTYDRASRLIVGDDDGLVVGTAQEFEAALPRAREIEDRESALQQTILGGSSLFDHFS